MNVIPYEPLHAVKIKVRDFDAAKREHKDWEKWAMDNSLQGPAWTIMEGQEIMACCGIRILWEGVGEAWLIFAPGIEHHALEATKIIKCYLRRAIDDCKLRRVQAFATVTAPKSAKYLETLGFEREGIMRKLGRDGSDHYVYAMVEG